MDEFTFWYILTLVCLLWFVCGSIGSWLYFMRQKLRRERHRLDRALNRYNSTYKDDYDFYNGF